MKNISEQQITDKKMFNVVNAPADELNILLTNSVLKNSGTLENLCLYPDGSPQMIRVGGKKYTAGKRTPKGNFLVYDGRVLVPSKENPCWFSYYNKDGKISRINGVPEESLKLQFTEVLSQFGINPNDETVDIYEELPQITKKLQSFIDKGGVSKMFRLWNDMLTYYYPNQTQNIKLKPKEGTDTFYPTVDKTELSTNYNLVDDMGRYGISYKGGEFPVYIPKSAGLDLVKPMQVSRETEYCYSKLGEYLGAAVQYGTGAETKVIPQLNDFKREIIKCNATGVYEKFRGFEETLTDDQGNQINFFNVKDKLSPFGLFNKKLGWGEVKKMLSGKTDYIKRGSPYVMSLGESEETSIKNIIRENLIKVNIKKKTTLQLENKIIKNRLNIISESSPNKTEKQVEIFNNNLISEIVYLNKQGFNRELISENVWEMLKGFFGTGVDAGVETFKEYLASFLVNTLTPFDSDSWIGGTIVKSLGNVPIGDYFNGKILECDYITKLLAKSILEEGIDKMLDNMELDGAMYDVLRNALVDIGEDTAVGQKLEKGLASMVCSKMKGVKNKMDNLGDTLKSKAFGT
jgi:hypothetical protein